jgi:hypothetical protein
MAAKDRTTLINEVNQYIADNANNEISAADVRTRLIDIIDSYLNLVSDQTSFGLKEYSETNVYTAGDHVVFNSWLYKCSQTGATGTFDPTKWDFNGSRQLIVKQGVNANGLLIDNMSNDFDIIGITIKNESANATGYISIGKTLNGSEFLDEETIPTTGNKRKYFDSSQIMDVREFDENLYIKSDAWGTGSVSVYVHIIKTTS